MSATSDASAVQAIAYSLQLCIGGVFLVAVVPKLRNPRRFGRTVASYEILPRALTGPAAALVICCELALVVSFLTGWAVAVGLAFAGALSACFAGATAINLRRGRDIDCGCFGGASEKISSRSLARLGILGVGLLVLAGLVASGDASALTIAWWAEDGARLSYTLEALGISLGLTLVAAWALEFSDLLRVLQRSERAAARSDVASQQV